MGLFSKATSAVKGAAGKVTNPIQKVVSKVPGEQKVAGALESIPGSSAIGSMLGTSGGAGGTGFKNAGAANIQTPIQASESRGGVY